MEKQEGAILDKFQEDFPLFIEAGFIAVKQWDEAAARGLFEAARLLRPESVASKIGFGYIYLNKLELNEASKCFREVIAVEPDNYLSVCLLGFCHLLNKKEPNEAEGKRLINEAIEKTKDPTVVNLGKVALKWYEVEVKRTSKSPYFEAPKEES
jgi:tetratricopeptide (TPR) repeat protein